MLADAVIDDRNTPAALVTGGSSALGKAICELLSRNGYLVAVADRDELGARAVADACGGLAVAVDVTDEAAVASMVAKACDGLGGRLDALVTSVSVVDAASVDDGDEVAALQRVHAVHVLGTFLCIREAARRMTYGGRICTIAPVATNSAVGESAGAPYAVARGSVVALTRHAARTLAPSGIFVNGVVPGIFAQPTVPSALGERFGPNQQVAEAVVWLLSPRAASVNGEIITVGAEPH
jgi:NAD(P)-dependent dehydrogenase (short-subunit alcohol dehydrogenase family)